MPAGNPGIFPLSGHPVHDLHNGYVFPDCGTEDLNFTHIFYGVSFCKRSSCNDGNQVYPFPVQSCGFTGKVSLKRLSQHGAGNPKVSGTIFRQNRLGNLHLGPPFRPYCLGSFIAKYCHGLFRHFPDDLRVRAINPQLNLATQGRAKIKLLHIDHRIRQQFFQVILDVLDILVNELVIIHRNQQIAVLVCRLHRSIVGEDKTGMTATDGRCHLLHPFNIIKILFNLFDSLLGLKDMVAFSKLHFHLKHGTGRSGKEQLLHKTKAVQRGCKHPGNDSYREPAGLDCPSENGPINTVKLTTVWFFLCTLFGVLILFTENKLFGHQWGNGHRSQPGQGQRNENNIIKGTSIFTGGVSHPANGGKGQHCNRSGTKQGS